MRRAVVVFLALTMLGAGACRKDETTSPNPNVANKVALRLVQLYYETPRMLLAPEPRNVSLPESPAAAIPVVVTEMLKGPSTKNFFRIFPQDTTLRGAYLLPGGTVVVDLGGETLSAGWGTGSHDEILAAYSLVQTLTENFTEVRSVRIVINGSPAETLAGHISLARSLTPKAALLDRSAPPPAAAVAPAAGSK